MKKSIRILAVALALLMVMVVFASCAKTISGTYEAEVDGGILGKYTATYEFSGKNVTVTRVVSTLLGSDTATLEGTYEITEKDDGTMEITLNFETSDDHVKSGTFAFEEGDGYIKIGLVQYNKK